MTKKELETENRRLLARVKQLENTVEYVGRKLDATEEDRIKAISHAYYQQLKALRRDGESQRQSIVRKKLTIQHLLGRIAELEEK
uniref:Uncharacterized protein n=1 Tax=viral metagenome TaxID=1070528 RepID=A0A6M3LIF3_9ZZZZ